VNSKKVPLFLVIADFSGINQRNFSGILQTFTMLAGFPYPVFHQSVETPSWGPASSV